MSLPARVNLTLLHYSTTSLSEPLIVLEAFQVCYFPCTENGGHWPASKPDHLKVVSPLGLFASSSSGGGSLSWKLYVESDRFSNLLASSIGVGDELLGGEVRNS